MPRGLHVLPLGVSAGGGAEASQSPPGSEAQTTPFGTSHRFGTWRDRCVLPQPQQVTRTFTGHRQRHPESLAGLQGVSQTSAGYSSSTEHTVQRTARHPGAEVKDPPCHRLGRQAGGKLPAELPGASAARRELPGLFGCLL